jgi:hypothetical protein
MKTDPKKQTHRLFIQVIDKNRKEFVNEIGQVVTPVKWVEVARIDLGSLKNPNKEILEFKVEPLLSK